jgi:hypothetical protein
MVTKATRDVISLTTARPIVDTFAVIGDCGAAFQMDGVPIGGTVPCDGTFVNMTATNLVVTGTINGTGATLIGTWAATYADIAECYESDADYPPGTVVKLGGDKEITITDRAVDEDVFGVISSEPAYLLNSNKKGLYLPVVLVGRVPVRVIGPVTKGDRLVSSNIDGVARTMEKSERACHTPMFGRSLETSTAEHERLVEVAFVTIR